MPYEGIKGVTLTISYASTAEGEAVFKSLSEGGTVTMPFQPAFLAKGAGMLTDRSGTPWVINGEATI
jgi:PhnB protein